MVLKNERRKYLALKKVRKYYGRSKNKKEARMQLKGKIMKAYFIRFSQLLSKKTFNIEILQVNLPFALYILDTTSTQNLATV